MTVIEIIALVIIIVLGLSMAAYDVWRAGKDDQ